MTLIDEMYTALEKLGSTAGEVRDSLVNKGISLKCCGPEGFTHSAYNCPLQAYLSQQFPEVKKVVVGPSNFSNIDDRCNLPSGAQDFVTQFDEHLLKEK